MLRYTLLSDGSSDRALGPIVTYVVESWMRERGRSDGIRWEWADFSGWRRPPAA